MQHWFTCVSLPILWMSSHAATWLKCTFSPVITAALPTCPRSSLSQWSSKRGSVYVFVPASVQNRRSNFVWFGFHHLLKKKETFKRISPFLNVTSLTAMTARQQMQKIECFPAIEVLSTLTLSPSFSHHTAKSEQVMRKKAENWRKERGEKWLR